jgi:hypothetical protein
MVKNIAYFPSQAARNAPPVLAAVLAGLQRHGITVVENSLDADAALIWSVLWHGRMRGNQKVYEHYRSLGRDVIIIDIGCLSRGHTWKIARNHVTAQGHYGHHVDLDWDRPRRLGIATTSKNIQRRPDILVACQHARSLQVEGMPDQATWAQQWIDTIREHTARPIVVRPHPRSRFLRQVQGAHTIQQHPRLLAGTYDSFDIEFDYHAVINHNSGPGIQAAVQGCPVLVHDTSLAHPVSISMEQIDDPPPIDYTQWLVEICHTEWLLEEIVQGAWVARLGLRC